MSKFIFTAIFIIGIFLSPISKSLKAEELSLDEIQDAACYILVKDSGSWPMPGASAGSGTVVNHADGKYYILTNGHIFSIHERPLPAQRVCVSVSFFRNGFKSKAILAKLEKRYYTPTTSCDMAIVSIPDTAFNNTQFKPRVIPIAPQSYDINTNNLVYGCGCPQGLWCQSWNSHITKFLPFKLLITMPPVDGQSGSGILTTVTDSKGNKTTALIGIVSWRFEEGTSKYGGCVSLYRIYDILSGKPHQDRINTSWHLMSSSDDDVCKNCNQSITEHYGVYDTKTNNLVRDKDKFPQLWCKETLKKIRLTAGQVLVQYGQCPTCPNGQCPMPNWGMQQQPQLPFNDGPPPNILSPWPDELEKQQPPVAPNIGPPSKLPPTPVEPPVNPLQGKLDELNKTIEDIQAAKNNTDKKLSDTKQKLDSVSKEKDDTVQKLTTANQAHEQTKQTLAQTLGNLAKSAAENKDLQSKLEQLVNKNKDNLDKFNIPYVSRWLNDLFGIGWGTLLSILTTCLASGAFITTLWHNYIYPWLVKKYGFFPAKIIDVIGRRTLAKRLAEKKNEIVVDKTQNSSYNSVVENATTNNTVVIENQTKISQGNHIEDLFAHGGGKLNGITAKDWAIKSGLYKKAVDLLKQGMLTTLDGKGIFNCVIAANTIENYVTNAFMETIKLPNIKIEGNLVHEAYLAYLYYIAVQKLKNGEFPILGYSDAAQAIELWVMTEFRNKVGM